MKNFININKISSKKSIKFLFFFLFLFKNQLSIVEKEATEMFLLDLVFEISDYFICVVNDFTSLD